MSAAIGQAGGAAGLGVLQAFLVFGGIPLVIVAAIWTVVAAAERRTARHRSPAPPAPAVPPRGLAACAVACWVCVDDRDQEIHYTETDERPDGAGQLTTVCWTAQCADCGRDYREGPELVHFAGPAQAIRTIHASGWDVVGGRLRCRRCR